jgi:hypothetical protein
VVVEDAEQRMLEGAEDVELNKKVDVEDAVLLKL